MNSIFVISQTYIKANSTNPISDCNIETRGYWFSFEKAQKFMKLPTDSWWFEEYYKDINEGNVIYFVIEEIDEGFAPQCKELQWFKLQIIDNVVKPVSCDKPNELKQLAHFGMS